MMKHVLWISVMMMAAIAAGGCGSSSNSGGSGVGGAGQGTTSGGGGNGGAPAPAAPASACQDAWNQYVAANPAGHFEEYSLETRMKHGGHEFVISSGSETHTVTTSNQDQVVITIATDHGSNDMTLTHDQFIQACGNSSGGTVAGHPGTSMEVISQGQQSIDTPAGHFDCDYVKGKLTTTTNHGNAVTYQETWTQSGNVHGLTVKSVTTTEIGEGAAQSVETTTKLLVKRG